MHIALLKIIPNNSTYTKDLTIINNINNFSLKPNITYNDFIKINNERLAFISTNEYVNILYILIFDLYDDYASIKIRTYNYDISPYTIDKELALFEYNGYLVFSSTVSHLLWNIFLFLCFLDTLFGKEII